MRGCFRTQLQGHDLKEITVFSDDDAVLTIDGATSLSGNLQIVPLRSPQFSSTLNTFDLEPLTFCMCDWFKDKLVTTEVQ